MTSESTAVTMKPTYEDFRDAWLRDITSDDLSTFARGLKFGAKLVTQWLDVTSDDDDFIICDGSGDGGIDIAYLQRGDDESEGDTWYVIQSKYGSAFIGTQTILEEGNKVINTLQGKTERLSEQSTRLLEKLNVFMASASDVDRIVLVIATTDPIAASDRDALDNIKLIGRERVMGNFDVEEVSLLTIWESLDEVESSKLTVSIRGKFVEQYSGLLVGTVGLPELFEFLKKYQRITGNLDQIYEKNVRQFLGNRRKINKGIAETLNQQPEKFGLYNNGITIVVSSYSQNGQNENGRNDEYAMHDPYIVNGCQTTRTIWQVLDTKMGAGGTGQDKALQAWNERVKRGGVVTKVVSSDEAEITNITQFTNSQNSVRPQDFIALNNDFKAWAAGMAETYNIFFEIQRGGIDSRRAWERQHPEVDPFTDYVNGFEVIKVYGAGWLDAPGLAFGKNPPFLPNGAVYQRMVDRLNGDIPFGINDLYAAYKMKCAADGIGFGRNATQSSRRQSRFLFYYILTKMLSNVILLTPQFRDPPVTPSVVTDAILKLTLPDAEDQFTMLGNAALALLDQYLTYGSDSSAHNERSFTEVHNGDLNAFLKAENLGGDDHSPLLVQLLAQHNQAFASIPMPMYEGNPTQREFVARALTNE